MLKAGVASEKEAVLLGESEQNPGSNLPFLQVWIFS